MIRDQKGTSIIERSQNYTCVDLETTRLSSTWNEIIEIGAAKVRNNTIIEKYTQLIKPETPIPGIVTAITEITNEMVENAPTIETVLPQFITWLGNDTILGHNVGFDINFLYDNAQQILNKPVTNNYIDTLRIARLIHPEEKHNRLQDLITRYKIGETQEHRALAGILAPTITQLTKRYIPDEWRKTFAIAVSIITALFALTATNGFDTQNWGVLIVTVIGISQTLYTVYDGTKTVLTV